MLNVVFSRVRDGEVERLRAWGRELMQRSDEVRDTFRQEGVRHESSYLIQTADGWIHVIAIEVENMEKAQAAYDASKLPIDSEHREVMRTALAGQFPAERIYEMSL
jgi:hypothetical protein